MRPGRGTPGPRRLWARVGVRWGARIYPAGRVRTPTADIRVRAPGQARACRWRHFLLVARAGPGPSAAPRAGGLLAFGARFSVFGGAGMQAGSRPLSIRSSRPAFHVVFHY